MMPENKMQKSGHTAVDPRRALFTNTLRKNRGNPNALIEVLHSAQELFGYLPKDLLREVSGALDVPPSKVYGVATFYHFFGLAPKGLHSCIVCMGTACYVKQASDILAVIKNRFGLEPEQVSAHGELSLSVARCFGSCGQAPVVLIDGQVQVKTNPDAIKAQLQSLLKAVEA